MKKLLTIGFILSCFFANGQAFNFLTQGGAMKSMRVYDSAAVRNLINGKVATVTGDLVDNSDPLNPVVGLTGTHTLLGDADIEIGLSKFHIGANNGNVLDVDPTTHNQQVILDALDDEGGTNTGRIKLNSTQTDAHAVILANFDGGTKLPFIELFANATNATITHTADTHTFNGLVGIGTTPDLLFQVKNGVDSFISVDAAHGVQIFSQLGGSSISVQSGIGLEVAGISSGGATVGVNGTFGSVTIAGSTLSINNAYVIPMVDGTPNQVLQTDGAGTVNWADVATGTVTSIATSNGITGGTITGTGTISGINAVADGSTKGVASFTANDFNATTGNISIDYTNGQAASGSVKGFLTAADWTTFNGKGSVTSVAALTLGTTGTDLGSSVANGTTTPVITLNVPTASASNRGALSSTDWSTFNSKQATVSVSSPITLTGASIGMVNQGTTTTVLHGNAAGNPSFGAIVNGDITNSTIDLTAKVTGILPAANGGSGINNSVTLNFGAGGTLGSNAFTSTAYAPIASPTFTGTVTIPTPFTLGATSVTSTGTQLNYLNAATGTTGTTNTNVVFSTSPTLVTPTLGVATATSLNGNTFTTGTYVLTGAAAKTLTFSNSLTLAGTDATTMTFPSISSNIATIPKSGFVTGSDVTTTSSTAADITGLTVAVQANKIYRITASLWIGCNNTGGVKLAINGPAGSALRVGQWSGNVTTNNTGRVVRANAIGSLTAVVLNNLNTAGGMTVLTAYVTTAGTAGNVTLQFASGTNTETSTVFIGSTVDVTEVQ